jgi:dolichyl-phosphate beta-glucosyltransferase
MIVQSLLLPGIRDTQCGFKLFTHKAAQDLYSLSEQNGFAFDVEILLIARRKGYKIKEIAINWTNVEGSKVNVFVDPTGMLMQVLSITLASWFGKYRTPPTPPKSK